MGRPSSIILVGPMGSGKTAVGRALAKILGRDFFDTDRHVEERTGVDIAFIFEKEGEAGFRRRETDAIQHFAVAPPGINSPYGVTANCMNLI